MQTTTRMTKTNTALLPSCSFAHIADRVGGFLGIGYSVAALRPDAVVLFGRGSFLVFFVGTHLDAAAVLDTLTNRSTAIIIARAEAA